MVECVLVRHVVAGSNPVHSAEMLSYPIVILSEAKYLLRHA